MPKPKSSASPKPGRSTPQETTVQKQTTDLLGLQNGDDGFMQFISNSSVTPNVETTTKKEENSESIQAEEKSFFNQPAPSEKERIKMTKDSIMALYATAPTQPIAYPNPIGQFQPNMAPNSFQQPYQFPQNFPQQVQPNQNFPAQQFSNLQNGTQNIPTNVPFMTQNPQNVPQFNPGQNQFITSPYGQNTPFGNANLLAQNQFQAPMVGQNVPMANPANPFCGTMPLQQQFAGMNLTGNAVNNSVNNVGKPATANIWQ